MNAYFDNFIAALRSPTSSNVASGMQVYRNTVALAEREALSANFPTVLSLVGQEAIDALAHFYAQSEQPKQVCLIDYGENFATWLKIALHDPTQMSPHELPDYIADVALLDRAWTISHTASDAAALCPADMQSVLEQGAQIKRHPAAQSFFFCDAPIAQLFIQSRSGQKDFSNLKWLGGGVMFSRAEDEVRWVLCSQTTHQLLEQLKVAQTVPDLLNHFSTANLDTSRDFFERELGQSLYELFAHGAVCFAPN